MLLIPALRSQRQADFWVRGQPGLQSEFQDSQGYTEKPCLKNKQTNKNSSKGRWLGGYTACCAAVRTWVWSLAPRKCQVCQCTPVTLVWRKWRQGDHKFRVIFACIAQFEACLEYKGYSLKVRWKLNKVAKGEKQLKYVFKKKWLALLIVIWVKNIDGKL